MVNVKLYAANQLLVKENASVLLHLLQRDKPDLGDAELVALLLALRLVINEVLK